MENDLLKRIIALENELKQLKKDNLAMFGRTYSQVGDTKSDLVLNTRGQVKIRIGGKFIDLIKNNEINVDTDIIFTASEKPGSKDGIYILDNGSVYLKYRDKEINLVGETGTTYVSFKDTQETTSEEKLQALHNIGFYCEDLDSLGENSIQNGIVFIEADQSLYIIKDGVGSKFMQVIQDTVNSILDEKESEKEETKSEIDLPFRIEGNNVVFTKNPVFNQAKSRNATKYESGFYLYEEDDLQVLEIDKLIIHDKVEGLVSTSMHPLLWDANSNIIKTAYITSSDGPQEAATETKFFIDLVYPNQYEQGTILYVWAYTKENGKYSTPFLLELKVESTEDYVLEVSTTYEGDLENTISNLTNAIVYISNKFPEPEPELPEGAVILYYGTEAPEGWKICENLPLITNDAGETLAIYITNN